MFQAKVKIIKFDKKGYTDALGKAIQIQMKQAAKEWLRAVILKVPLYTGMARGSLLPLGRFLKVHIDVSPEPQAVKKHPNQNAAAGELQGYFNFSHENHEYTFSFKTDVEHYLINEFNVGLGSPPLKVLPPWHSFEAGKAAWEEYINTEFKRKLPKISEFITLVEIS